MKKKVIGDFLFQFYRKRTSSFLAGIYKSTITGESEDIHQLRVDVKKIYALYSLFEMIHPDQFKKHLRYKPFINLFKLTGRIREIQVHLIFLSRPKFKKNNFYSFFTYLEEQEKKATKDFLSVIKDFNDKELKSTEKEIRKICIDIPVKQLSGKSGEFIGEKTKKIQYLLTGDPGNEKVHKIRKHLKAMSTVLTLVDTINPDDRLSMIISGLNKSEEMIGEWHDKIVLSGDIDLYLKDRKETSEEDLTLMTNLRQSLMDDNQNLLLRLLPEVKKVTDMIILLEEERKSGSQNSITKPFSPG